MNSMGTLVRLRICPNVTLYLTQILVIREHAYNTFALCWQRFPSKKNGGVLRCRLSKESILTLLSPELLSNGYSFTMTLSNVT